MFRSLSSKVITVSISVTVLVVLITSAVFVSLFSTYAYNDKSDALLSCAESVADFISRENVLEEKSIEKDFSDYAGVVSRAADASVWVCKNDGFFVIVKNSSVPVSVSQLSKEEQMVISEALSEKKEVTKAFSDYFGEKTISAVVPVFGSNNEIPANRGVIGVVLMHSPATYMNELFQNSVLLLAISFVAAMLIALIVGIILGFRITRPVKEMCRAASQLANGDFNVSVTTDDQTELQDLAYAINHLAYNLGNNFTRIKNEKDKLNNIIENVSDGLASFDTNMHLQTYNMALLRLCSQNQLEDPAVTDMIMNVMTTGEKKTVVVNGKDILKFTATRIQNGTLTEGVVVIVQDISQSERLNQLRTEFVANVSHEFRTPLTIIKGSVEALMDGAVETEDEKMVFYNRIETESKALERLVRDLLDTSKYKAGKIVLEIHPTDATWLLCDIVAKLKSVAEKKDISLVFEPVELPDIAADYDRLRQMLIIFIDNAIKFTPEGGTVTVTASAKEDGYAYISVKDTGCGIPEEDIPYIFDRFYKVDKARGGSETGTGLGLSIAWEIANLHKGTVLVESEIDKGTTFTIVIPLADEEETDETDENS